MLKLLGAALLLAGSAGVGLGAVRGLERRAAALGALTQALALMEQELDFRLPPMGDLIFETAKGAAEPAASFLRACGEGLDGLEGRPLSGLWQRAARATLPMLKRRDLEALFAVGAVLGRYDEPSQRRAIASARARLDELWAGAVQERRRQGRVYGALSVTAGAFLVILLL